MHRDGYFLKRGKLFLSFSFYTGDKIKKEKEKFRRREKGETILIVFKKYLFWQIARINISHLALPFFSRLCLSKFHLKTWPDKKASKKRGTYRWLRKGLRLCLEREREIEKWARREEGRERKGGERRGEKAKERKLLFSCFELFPEDRLTHAVFHRSGWRREGGGDGGGRKRITSTEGEWHKVENLPVVYRLVYNTGLSERPRSPASPLLWAKLKALDKLPDSLSRSPTTQIHHFLSYFRRPPPPPLVYTGFYTIRKTKICIYIYTLCWSLNETFCTIVSTARHNWERLKKREIDAGLLWETKPRRRNEAWRESRRASRSYFNFYPSLFLLFSPFFFL